MAITLADLKNNERELHLDYFGDSFEITYKPGLVTPEREDEFLNTKDSSAENICFFLVEVLVKWTVLDKPDGKPIEITVNNLYELPDVLLFNILKAIFADGKGDDEDLKNSDNSSFGAPRRKKGRRTSMR